MIRKLTNRHEIRIFTALCCIVYFTSYLTRLNYAASLTAIIEDMGTTKALASLAVTGSFFTYGLGQVLSGCVGDLVRPHRMIILGLCGTSVCNVLLPLMPSAGVMSAVWCVNGFFQAMLWPPLVRIMAEYLQPEDYQRASVFVSAASSVGTVAVYFLVPLCILAGGWRIAFYAAAVCGVGVAVLWRFGARAFGLTALTGSPARWEQQRPQTPLRHIFRASGLGLIAVAIILQGTLRDGITTWMPTTLTDVYHIPAAAAIAVTAIVSMFNIVSVFTASYLQNKLHNELLTSAVLFAVSLGSTALLVPFYASGVVFSSLLMSLAIAGSAGVNHMLISRVPVYFARYNRVSTMSGLLNFFTYVGSALSTYGIALLSEHFGWAVTIAVWAAIALVGTLCCALRVPSWKRFSSEKPLDGPPR